MWCLARTPGGLAGWVGGRVQGDDRSVSVITSGKAGFPVCPAPRSAQRATTAAVGKQLTLKRYREITWQPSDAALQNTVCQTWYTLHSNPATSRCSRDAHPLCCRALEVEKLISDQRGRVMRLSCRDTVAEYRQQYVRYIVHHTTVVTCWRQGKFHGCMAPMALVWRFKFGRARFLPIGHFGVNVIGLRSMDWIHTVQLPLARPRWPRCCRCSSSRVNRNDNLIWNVT